MGSVFAKLICILLVIMLFAAGGNNAFAGWQAGASVGIDWNRSLSSQIGYTFATTDGEIGTSRAHTGFLDISYRF